MLLKIVILAILLWDRIYDIIIGRISDRHDKKPLPEEVQGIYDPERYQKYLSRKAEYRRLSYIRKPISFAIDCVFFLSPFYRWIESLAGERVYLIALLTVIIVDVIEELVSIPFSYYSTFVIEERYELNKTTKKTFIKDTLIDFVSSGIMSVGVIMLLTFICQKVGKLVQTIEIKLWIALVITAAIYLLITLFGCVMGVIRLVSLRATYKFEDMPEGELRDKIMALTKGSKKKLRRIAIYNESSKSTSKNAFLLKFLWIREFGIADNFMDGNSERELLAVLAHEAGHLKYKKTVKDYLGYIPTIICFVVIALLIHNPGFFYDFGAFTRQSFGLQYPNYYLLIMIVIAVIQPLFFVRGVASKARSRRQEYDADTNAVKEGYGKELKETFMKMSTDELVNVNPAPFIEWSQYSHPSMYNRIRAINWEMELMARMDEGATVFEKINAGLEEATAYEDGRLTETVRTSTISDKAEPVEEGEP